MIDGLAEAGVLFYSWPETDPETTTIRLVTRHDTADADVDALIETAHPARQRGGLAGAGPVTAARDAG